LKRKDNIIIVAIDLLDEAGIHGMTTKEIAKRQNITEPAIYRQFSSKKEIILTILKKFSDFDHSIYNTVIEHKMKCMDGIRFFMNAYADYYQNYPQIATVMLSYDMFHYDDETNKTMKKIIYNRRKFVIDIIEKGQSLSGFNKDICSEDVADMVIGIIWSTTYRWKLEDCSFSLKQKFSEILDQCIGSWACTNANTVGSEK